MNCICTYMRGSIIGTIQVGDYVPEYYKCVMYIV